MLASESITISHVLLTHWHTDHTGGVPDLLAHSPHLTSHIYKHTPSASQAPIHDGQIFATEGATLTAAHTPGHAADHMCFVLREEDALFTGDNLLGHGTTVVENLGTYMATLRTMRDLACIKGYPAHGALLPDLRAKIREQLEQKLRRERRVVASLRAIRDKERRGAGAGGGGGKGIGLTELVEVVYGDYMSRATRETVLEPVTEEILEKLEAEGRVRVVGEEAKGGGKGKKWVLVDYWG